MKNLMFHGSLKTLTGFSFLGRDNKSCKTHSLSKLIVFL